MRTILHSDANSFYASVECVYAPELKNVPMAVCGDQEMRHGIVLTKNQLAKRAGVQTGEAIWQAKQKCPDLQIRPANYSLYLRFSHMLKDIYARYTDLIEPFGLDECWLDVTGHPMGGEAIADEIRQRAREELGLTVSVGVSFNKIFAKLGSDMKKPDATTVISAENFREKVWPLPAGDLLFVGPATQRKLASRNIFTIGDLARCDVSVMRAMMGRNGEMLWRFANGLDQSAVRPLGDEAAVKSVGNSITTAQDMPDEPAAHAVLMILSESVAERLRESGLRGRVVSLYIRDNALNSAGFQKRLRTGTALASEICGTATALLREHYTWPLPLRSIGVSVHDLEDAAIEQLSLFPDRARNRRYAMECAVQDIRGRFGHSAMLRARVMHLEGDVNPKDDHTIHPVAWRKN